MAVWDDAIFLWHPGDTGVASKDLVTDADASGITEGSIVSHSGRTGRAYSGAVGSRFAAPLSPLDPAQDWTMFAVVRLPSAGQNFLMSCSLSSDVDQWAIIGPNSGGTGQIDLRGNGATTPGSNRWPFIATTNLNGNTDFVVYVARFTTTSDTLGTLEAFEDSSTLLGSDDWDNVTGVAVDRLTIGRLEDSSPSNSAGGQVYAAGMWDRAITGGEIDEILANPFAYLATGEAHTRTILRLVSSSSLNDS